MLTSYDSMAPKYTQTLLPGVSYLKLHNITVIVKHKETKDPLVQC